MLSSRSRSDPSHDQRPASGNCRFIVAPAVLAEGQPGRVARYFMSPTVCFPVTHHEVHGAHIADSVRVVSRLVSRSSPPDPPFMRGNQRNGPALETVHFGGRGTYYNPPWATAMERDAGRSALAWLTRQPTPGPRVGCQAQWVACGDGAAARCPASATTRPYPYIQPLLR